MIRQDETKIRLNKTREYKTKKTIDQTEIRLDKTRQYKKDQTEIRLDNNTKTIRDKTKMTVIGTEIDNETMHETCSRPPDESAARPCRSRAHAPRAHRALARSCTVATRHVLAALRIVCCSRCHALVCCRRALRARLPRALLLPSRVPGWRAKGNCHESSQRELP